MPSRTARLAPAGTLGSWAPLGGDAAKLGDVLTAEATFDPNLTSRGAASVGVAAQASVPVAAPSQTLSESPVLAPPPTDTGGGGDGGSPSSGDAGGSGDGGAGDGGGPGAGGDGGSGSPGAY
jgi:hypothetical protein